MQILNLPSYEFRFKNSENKTFIFDCIRKKFVLCTPEEWVRQHWIRWMIDNQSVPVQMIQVEKQIKVGQKQKRFDMIIYKRNGNIWLLMEFKKPDVEITQDTLNQINTYNISLQADYMMVSNGIVHKLFETKNMQLNFTANLPSYS